MAVFAAATLFAYTSALVSALFFGVGQIHAATTDEMNFQARLLQDNGALVPDGDYHAEFKLYDSASAGGSAQGVCVGGATDDCLWLETRTTGNLVRVANGYLSVNLGSVTSFGSGIDWSQEMWLSVNIGGIDGSPDWDGEMTPRIKVTAVPFAFSADNIDGLDSTDLIQIAPAAEQEVNSALTVINIDQAGAGALMDLQVGDASKFQVSNAGALTVASTGTFQGASVTIGGAGQAGSLILYDGSSNTVTFNTEALGGNYSVSIPTEIDENDTFCLESVGNCNGLGGLQAAYEYGNSITTTDADNGILFNLANTTDDEDFIVDILGTGNTLEVRDAGVAVFTISDGGSVVFATEVDSVTGFQVLDTDGGTPIFNVDTTNERVGIGTAAPGNKLTVQDGSDGVGERVLLLLKHGGTQAGDDTSLLLQPGAGSVRIRAFAPGNNDTDLGLYVTDNGVESLALFIDGDGGKVGLGTAAPSADLTFGEGASRTLNVLTRTTNAAGNNLTVSAGTAGAGANAYAGGVLALQGGNAGGTGNANGGNVTIQAGTGVGTGVTGLVVISTPAYSTVTNASCGTSCTITQANVDSYSAIIVNATADALDITMPDPTITTAGRVIYVTGADGTYDFTLIINSGATEVQIAMRENSTATLIWNGSDWTAAGASSSTTLQAAYDNTLVSAGGAEIVLNNTASSNGLTIRNNTANPILGGVLEVQSSIGTNIFAVNNYHTELAANGGAETLSSFATDWTAAPAGGTVTRETATASYIATGQASVKVVTTTTNHGVRNNLNSNPSVSTSYQVSFTGKLASGTFTTLDVRYSRDGGTDLEACTDYSTNTLVTTGWTKITCTITTDSTAATNPDLIIRQTDATGRTFYIDNLSFSENSSTSSPSNVQIGGGELGGPVTLFTLDRSSTPPVASGDSTYFGSMYYDTTTGRIQCYEEDGWGACGAPPNNIITLTPEYAGSVLNGTGVGTMSADFCADESGVLQINDTICASGEAVNYYEWTSPQATSQTYSVYLTYQLPVTFEKFLDDNTITLDAYTTDTDDAAVTYEVFRSTGSAITECGSDTTVTTSDNTWQTVTHNGNEATGCSFAAGDRVIFKLNMTARNNDYVYVSDINFTYSNQ